MKSKSKQCPICETELEQETYYNEALEDTSYYDFCPKCLWDNYPYNWCEGK